MPWPDTPKEKGMNEMPVCPDWWPAMLWKLHFPPPRPGPGPGPINFPPALDSIFAALITHTLSYMYLDKEVAEKVRALAEQSILRTVQNLSSFHAGATDAGSHTALSGPPTWTNDIRKLFTEVDVEHMRPRGYDLSNFDDVKAKSADILSAVQNKRMPPGNPWPPEWVDLFKAWITGGFVK
jgi:hypothetical protein